MFSAFCLDGFIEYNALRGKGLDEARKIALALKKNSSGPVFFIKDGDALKNRVSFNNLADPLHALSRFVQVTGDEEIRTKVREALNGFLALQGPKGQWWWTYSNDGKVLQRYPVYTIHQTAAGPFAIKPAAKVVPELAAAVKTAEERSLNWLWGDNELGKSLYDEEHRVLWRSITPPKLMRKARQLTSIVPETMFRFDKETRSYEYGWSLYAQSGAFA